jgi:hypothetical protein
MAEQKFLTSLKHPFALVAHGSKQPGRRPGTSMAWLEWLNPDGSYDGGEIRNVRGCSYEWMFMYKRQKRFSPEEVLHIFPTQRGHSRLKDKTTHFGGPTKTQIRWAKNDLPVIQEPPAEVERPWFEEEAHNGN